MAPPSNTADRRAQIVRALIAVMAKRGYDGASVVDVARKAGLAPGLVHYHFKSKLEILVEAVRAIAAAHERALDDAAPAAPDPAAEMGAFVDVHLGLGAHAAPDLLACWVLVVAEALRERRVRREVEAALARLTARAADIIARGNAAGAFACADVEGAAAAIVATIQGYFSVAATARGVIPAGSAARCTKLMVAGLLGAPSKKPRRRGVAS